MDPESQATQEVIETPPNEDASASQEGESTAMTMSEAWDAALAEREAAESAAAGDSTPESQTQTETPDTQTPPTAETKTRPSREDRQWSQQAALQSVLDLVRQGRESELTPETRGIFNAWKAELETTVRSKAGEEFRQRQEKERDDRETFLAMEAMREDEPDKFVETLLTNPQLATFHRAYKAAHPEASLDNPDAPERYDRNTVNGYVGQAIERNDASWREGIDTFFSGLAQKHGVNYQELRATHSDAQLGTLMERVIEATMEAAWKGRLETAKKAWLAEYQALNAGKNLPESRPSSGARRAADSPATQTGRTTMAEAWEAAERQLAASR